MRATNISRLVLFLCFEWVSARMGGIVRRVNRMNVFADGKVRATDIRQRAEAGDTITKTALLIHSGIMRGYKQFWPTWEKNFIKPSEAAGVRFTIAVSTDLHDYCDPHAPDAWHGGRLCGCASWADSIACNPLLKMSSEDAKARFTREIQETYGPSSKGGPVHVQDLRLDRQKHFFNGVHARAMPILNMYENQTFDYIIVTRPDIVLVDAANLLNVDIEFNLVSLCNSHPGMNLISGSFTRKDDVHHRDWDWGYMLCDGKHQEDAKAVLFGESAPCSAKQERARKANAVCVPPNRSSDFVSMGRKWSCESRACSWFEGMEGKMRFGTLDNTLFGLFPPEPPRALSAIENVLVSPEGVPKPVARRVRSIVRSGKV